MARKQNIFTGIDIGTETVKTVIAAVADDGSIDMLGFAEVPSEKVVKGEAQSGRIVTEQTAMALDMACQNAGFDELPGTVAFVLSGGYVIPRIVRRTTAIPENQPITGEIVEKLMHDSYDDVPDDPEGDEVVLSMFTNRCFELEGKPFVFNPNGQYSPYLAVETRCLFAETYTGQLVGSIVKDATQNHNYETIYAPIAIASAVIRPQSNSEIHGMVIELGAGMTSIAMPTTYGYLVCEQLALGCDHIANDLDIGLDLQNIATARSIVRNMGTLRLSAVATHDGRSRMVSIASGGGGEPRMIPADAIETIIEARLDEIFETINNRLKADGSQQFLGNAVLLSGGGALIPGVTEIASRRLNRPVHVSAAYGVTDSSTIFKPGPRYNMVLGAIRAAWREREQREERRERHGVAGAVWRCIKSVFVD